MLDNLKAALTATGMKFAHYAWSSAPDGDYGVYAEDGASSVRANGQTVNQSVIGTIDYFTRDASDMPKNTIQDALNTLDIAWYLNSIQYENDTGYIHYEWVFEVV